MEITTGKTLKDFMPQEFLSFTDTLAWKYKDVKVTGRFETWIEGQYWPGVHKNVHIWVKLENGMAVGFNENPARGWSFPVIKL